MQRLSSAAAGLVPPDAPAISSARTPSSRRWARRPLLVRSGGTLPIVPALVDKGIPTIVTGFATPESSIHSPNERLLAEYMPLGIETAKELYRRLRGARPLAAVVDEPLVPEAAHLVDDRQERLALRGQLVLDARRRLGVAAADDDLLLLERAQPLRERPRADALAGVLELR